jgi:hypothetical protein
MLPMPAVLRKAEVISEPLRRRDGAFWVDGSCQRRFQEAARCSHLCKPCRVAVETRIEMAKPEI